MYLRIWTSNSKPGDVGRWYFDYLYDSKCLPNYLRIDIQGTETGVMAAMHGILSRMQEDVD